MGFDIARCDLSTDSAPRPARRPVRAPGAESEQRDAIDHETTRKRFEEDGCARVRPSGADLTAVGFEPREKGAGYIEDCWTRSGRSRERARPPRRYAGGVTATFGSATFGVFPSNTPRLLRIRSGPDGPRRRDRRRRGRPAIERSAVPKEARASLTRVARTLPFDGFDSSRRSDVHAA